MYHAVMSDNKTKFVFSVLAAASRVEGRLNRVLSNVKGVSFTEYCLLKELSQCHQGAATRVELASAVRLTPSAVTRALKPLEKIGYVQTQKGERDARQSIAALTEAGDELLRDASSLISDEIAALPLTDDIGAWNLGALQALASTRG